MCAASVLSGCTSKSELARLRLLKNQKDSIELRLDGNSKKLLEAQNGALKHFSKVDSGVNERRKHGSWNLLDLREENARGIADEAAADSLLGEIAADSTALKEVKSGISGIEK
jgi:hypothetical protein